MKKTSNKIFGGLLILGAVLMIASFIFVKIMGKDAYSRKDKFEIEIKTQH